MPETPYLKKEQALILAPLAGYTDIPFRRLCQLQGASLVFTELISAEGLVRRSQKTFTLMKINDSERPVGIQLFGKDPIVMAEAAKIAQEFSPDVIDINCGCCAQKVTNSGSGAALLKDTALLYRIASSIKNAVSIPVSAKIRLGWDHSSINYRETVKVLTDAGMSHITVHGRTKAMQYGGNADWNAIADICEFSTIPIIGNGDISSHAEALTRLHRSGCRAVMIGRKAIGNPWIFSGSDPTLDDRISMAKEHVRLMVEHYGEYGITLSRKHLAHYFHNFKHSSRYRSRLVVAPTVSEINTILDEIHAEIIEERL